MSIRSAPVSAHVTLAGAAVLHSFTHAFATMFAPLYLLMREDLRLESVSPVTLLVTIYGVVYWLLAFPAGQLADRYDRRVLLGVGLLGNAACITAMAFTQSYPVLVSLCVACGFFGSLFHPCANSLIPALYPQSPGMAIGLLGIGSGVGFFSGPFLAGYLAQSASQSLSTGTLAFIASPWQVPFLYLGLAGIVVAVVFLATAREAPAPASVASAGTARRRGFFGAHPPVRRPGLPPEVRRRTLVHAVLIALREFTSVGATTLSALFLLKALGVGTRQTGQILGFAMLGAAFVNPVVVYLTAGKRRLPAHIAVLIVAALVLVSIPFWPAAVVVIPMVAFQTLSLGSSAISDAGLAERISPDYRGRVNGIFLTIVGGSAATSPWIIGFAVDALGPRAAAPSAYLPLFAGLGLLILLATTSAYSLSRLGRPLTASPHSAPPQQAPANSLPVAP